MAKVLDEYALFLADSVSISGAYLMYEIASDYDRANVLQVKEKKEALKPYFKKYKESFPVTANYYTDPPTDAGNHTGNDEEINPAPAPPKAAPNRQRYLWAVAAVLVIIGVVLLAKRRS